MIIKTKVLDTIQALGADAAFSGGNLILTGFPAFSLKQIVNVQKYTYTAGVAQVTTGTPTAADSTTYQIVIETSSIFDSTPKLFTFILEDSGTGATATTICDAFRAQINANTDIPITASGTTTLVLTADSPYFTFTVVNSGPGVIAFVTGTPGVVGIGAGALLGLDEIGQIAGFTTSSTGTYTYYMITVRDNDNKNTGQLNDLNQQLYVLYVKSDATNFETLIGTYGTLTQALLGIEATYVAGTGTLAADDSDDLLTLAGGGTFTGQNIISGDVLFQVGETTYYPVLGVITTLTALANVAADNAAAAYTIIYLRPADVV